MALWTKYHKNGDQVKNGWVCDSCDGWNNRITKFCPHCGESMKAAMTVPTVTSVDEFLEASDWTDWIGKPTQEVYEIYWGWCIRTELSPVDKISFMKRVLSEYPELKSTPCKGKRYFRRVE